MGQTEFCDARAANCLTAVTMCAIMPGSIPAVWHTDKDGVDGVPPVYLRGEGRSCVAGYANVADMLNHEPWMWAL